MALLHLGHLLGRPGSHHGASPLSSFRSQVDDPVGRLDDIQVVLNDQDGGSGPHQAAKGPQQLVDIIEMQTGGGFVEQVERILAHLAGQVKGQLDPLGFPARERGGGLAQPEVAQPHILQHSQLPGQPGDGGEEAQCLPHGHLQHFVDILAFVAHLQQARFEASPLAFLAHQLHVRQKLHLHGNGSISPAMIAAASRQIEGKVTGAQPPLPSLPSRGKQLANRIEGLDVGDRIGAGGSADRRLVHQQNVRDPVVALHPPVVAPIRGLSLAGLQGGVEDLVNQCRLPGAGYSGDAGDDSEGNLRVQPLEVVLLGPVKPQPAAVRRGPGGGDGDLQLPAQILASERPAATEQLGEVPGENHLSSLLPRTGPHVDDAVRRTDHGGLVLHHQDGIAHVPQALEDLDQPGVVPRMQANGGLIQDVERPHQGGAQGGGQLNPLRLAPGQGRRQPVQRQVLQSDPVQKSKAHAQLLQDPMGHAGLIGGQPQIPEEFPGVAHRHGGDLSDFLSRDPDGPGLGTQPGPVAAQASGVPAVATQENAHIELVLLGFQIVEEAPDASKLLVPGIDQLLLPGKQVAVGDFPGDLVALGEALELGSQRPVAGLGPRLDGPLPQAFLRIGDHPLQIDIHGVAEPLAAGTGAKGVVERKQAGLGLLVADMAATADKSLVKDKTGAHRRFTLPGLRSRGRVRVCPTHHFDQPVARSFPVADFQRVGQALPQPRTNDDTIDQNLQRSGKVQIHQGLRVGQLVDASLPVEAVEALPAQVSQHGLEQFRLPRSGALLGGRTAFSQLLKATVVGKGKQDIQAGSRRERRQPADCLVQDIFFDLGPALPAVGPADSGEEQAQVIIDFGDRRHRGTGIAQAVLLLDGDGRRDPRHLLHVGFLDALQKLAGVGRERFDIAPLPLGIDGIEGQA